MPGRLRLATAWLGLASLLGAGVVHATNACGPVDHPSPSGEHDHHETGDGSPDAVPDCCAPLVVIASAFSRLDLAGSNPATIPLVSGEGAPGIEPPPLTLSATARGAPPGSSPSAAERVVRLRTLLL